MQAKLKNQTSGGFSGLFASQLIYVIDFCGNEMQTREKPFEDSHSSKRMHQCLNSIGTTMGLKPKQLSLSFLFGEYIRRFGDGNAYET